MADFLKKRLQIFVSSTYVDLKAERQAAVMAILEAGHIPAGMELFTAGDETQWEVIKQWIDESDAYFLILGGRYGSIDVASGKSYTHLEYEYALEKGKPVFACVVDEKVQEQRVKASGYEVDERDSQNELKAFRSLVLSKLSEFWTDTRDIQLTVLKKLSELSRRDDLVGWVRPTDQTNLPAVTDELTRLSRENADLREKIRETTIQFKSGLTVADISNKLQELELEDYFWERVNQFSVGFEASRNSDRAFDHSQIALMGLIESAPARYDGSIILSLSDDGVKYVNLIEQGSRVGEGGDKV